MDQQSLLKEIELPFYTQNHKGVRDWTSFGRESVLTDYKNKMQIKKIAEKYDTTKGSITGLLSRARLRGELPPIINSPTKGISKPRQRKVLDRPKLDPQSLRIISMLKARPKTQSLQPRVRLRMIESETEVTLLELKPHMCHWPIGDPKLSDFRFCGKIRLATSSYCTEHLAKSVRLRSR